MQIAISQVSVTPSIVDGASQRFRAPYCSSHMYVGSAEGALESCSIPWDFVVIYYDLIRALCLHYRYFRIPLHILLSDQREGAAVLLVACLAPTTCNC